MLPLPHMGENPALVIPAFEFELKLWLFLDLQVNYSACRFATRQLILSIFGRMRIRLYFISTGET
jgi:hypothetical protein